MRHNTIAVSSAGLGFALGGFFDGIVLHQILQWHHLLSLVDRAGDLAWQVFWDGLFHAAMYVIAAVSLWGLWRYRSIPVPGWLVPATLAAGFGMWHVIDAVLVHWILEWHHIRLDTASPVLWDVGWLTFFGFLPLVLAWFVMRRPVSPARPTAPLVLAALTIAGASAGAVAALPTGPASDKILVVFARAGGASLKAVLGATDASLLWNDEAMRVAILDLPSSQRWDLYRHGALLVSGTVLPAGCFGAIKL